MRRLSQLVSPAEVDSDITWESIWGNANERGTDAEGSSLSFGVGLDGSST